MSQIKQVGCSGTVAQIPRDGVRIGGARIEETRRKTDNISLADRLVRSDLHDGCGVEYGRGQGIRGRLGVEIGHRNRHIVDALVNERVSELEGSFRQRQCFGTRAITPLNRGGPGIAVAAVREGAGPFKQATLREGEVLPDIDSDLLTRRQADLHLGGPYGGETVIVGHTQRNETRVLSVPRVRYSGDGIARVKDAISIPVPLIRDDGTVRIVRLSGVELKWNAGPPIVRSPSIRYRGLQPFSNQGHASDTDGIVTVPKTEQIKA